MKADMEKTLKTVGLIHGKRQDDSVNRIKSPFELIKTFFKKISKESDQ